MNNVPISGISELQAHLQQLNDDSSLPIEVKLLDDVELQLTGKSFDKVTYLCASVIAC